MKKEELVKILVGMVYDASMRAFTLHANDGDVIITDKALEELRDGNFNKDRTPLER